MLTQTEIRKWISENLILENGKIKRSARTTVLKQTHPVCVWIVEHLVHWDIIDRIKIILGNNGTDVCPSCSENLITSVPKENAPFSCKLCSDARRWETIKASNLEKYGVENTFATESTKKKIAEKKSETVIKARETLKKNGKTWKRQTSLGDPGVRSKIEDTMTSRYGEKPFGNPVIKERRKKTNLEKHGVEYPSQNPEIRSKSAATFIENFRSRLPDEGVRFLENPSLMGLDSLKEIAEVTGISRTTVSRVLRKNGIPVPAPKESIEEAEFALEISGEQEIIRNDRSVLDGKEIDIWFPAKNLGVEYHGIYWHSTKDPEDYTRKHFDKSEIALEKGIKLLQFWSTEVSEKNEIVRSIIDTHLGKSVSIHGRKTGIRELSPSEHRIFCEANHLQGSTGAKVRLGLFHEGVLISLMSFGESRFSGKTQWEMIRFCNALGYRVHGGASKLWKHFVENWKPETVVTYADARISSGNLYRKLGFEYSHHSGPNYFYLVDGVLRNRVGFQKHKLPGFLGEKFDPSKTEKQNMTDAGYRIIYDAGNLVFKWKSK